MSQNSGDESDSKRGRPTKFNESLKSKITQLIEQGKTERQIAHIIGISPTTLKNWKGSHPDFLTAVRESRAIADELVEASLYHKAIGYRHEAVKIMQHEGQIITKNYIEHYPPDTGAAQFWLKNRQPDKWRDKSEIEHSGGIKNLSDDEMDKRIAELAVKFPELTKKLGGAE